MTLKVLGKESEEEPFFKRVFLSKNVYSSEVLYLKSLFRSMIVGIYPEILFESESAVVYRIGEVSSDVSYMP